MATNGDRKLYKPIPQERKVSSTYIPESEKTLVNIGRAFQENLEAKGDCSLGALQAKASAAKAKRVGVVHRLRSTPLGMRRAIDIYLPSVSNAVEDDEFSMLHDGITTGPNQLELLSEFDLDQDGQHSCANLESARRTIERARRLNESFSRAALKDDEPTPSTSFAGGAFGSRVSCMRHFQER